MFLLSFLRVSQLYRIGSLHSPVCTMTATVHRKTTEEIHFSKKIRSYHECDEVCEDVKHYNFRKHHINTTELSKKMDGILNRYNLESTGRIYTFGILKCSEKFKVLDLP